MRLFLAAALLGALGLASAGLFHAAFAGVQGARPVPAADQAAAAAARLPAGGLFCLTEGAAVSISEAAEIDTEAVLAEARLVAAMGLCFRTAVPLDLVLVRLVRIYRDHRGVTGEVWHGLHAARDIDVWILRQSPGKDT